MIDKEAFAMGYNAEMQDGLEKSGIWNPFKAVKGLLARKSYGSRAMAIKNYNKLNEGMMSDTKALSAYNVYSDKLNKEYQKMLKLLDI